MKKKFFVESRKKWLTLELDAAEKRFVIGEYSEDGTGLRVCDCESPEEAARSYAESIGDEIYRKIIEHYRIEVKTARN